MTYCVGLAGGGTANVANHGRPRNRTTLLITLAAGAGVIVVLASVVLSPGWWSTTQEPKLVPAVGAPSNPSGQGSTVWSSVPHGPQDAVSVVVGEPAAPDASGALEAAVVVPHPLLTVVRTRPRSA